MCSSPFFLLQQDRFDQAPKCHVARVTNPGGALPKDHVVELRAFDNGAQNRRGRNRTRGVGVVAAVIGTVVVVVVVVSVVPSLVVFVGFDFGFASQDATTVPNIRNNYLLFRNECKHRRGSSLRNKRLLEIAVELQANTVPNGVPVLGRRYHCSFAVGFHALSQDTGDPGCHEFAHATVVPVSVADGKECHLLCVLPPGFHGHGVFHVPAKTGHVGGSVVQPESSDAAHSFLVGFDQPKNAQIVPGKQIFFERALVFLGLWVRRCHGPTERGLSPQIDELG
mmetsp:Transcript_4721/g.10379  ORF Transcript_4721/g.10379 Transcript_4721/m.10379 type:complete len:281 (+) Transcript_4721:566-1408(+)